MKSTHQVGVPSVKEKRKKGSVALLLPLIWYVHMSNRRQYEKPCKDPRSLFLYVFLLIFIQELQKKAGGAAS